MIRILLVDDHPVVREGLAAVLADLPGLEVVGGAGTAAEAVLLARERRPDIVLLDLALPDRDGLSALPLLREAAPDARVLVFTAYETEEQVVGAVREGASGYLLKGAPADEIARAIRAVYVGGAYLQPRIAAHVLGCARPAARLSPRERQVLQLVADGCANKQIANALGITERTAKYHVTSLLTKLGAENRAQAVAIAGQRGLLDLSCRTG